VAERHDCRVGLDEEYPATTGRRRAGGRGTDLADGGTRDLRPAGHPFFVLRLFVPRTSSTPRRPHPLVSAFVVAARRAGLAP
jgi:CTP synthase (UTP-ammonia lyase)